MRFKEARTSIRGNNTSDESIIGQLLPEIEASLTKRNSTH